ncbi:MAG: hypothetical protein WC054_00565 [Candidatus Nanopelagicales bacterium]
MTLSEQTRRRFRIASLIIPLCLVIGSALCWSAFSTYHYVESPIVPGYIAIMLIVALDGTVVVTTPVWLSAVLPSQVRHYAAIICLAALAGSMAVNYAETGWPGVFPPLIAGALIHLVGVVLRAMKPAPAHVHERHQHVQERVQDEVEKALVVSEPAQEIVTEPAPVVLSLAKSPVGSPQEVAFAILDQAAREGRELPSGPELVAAVRKAGHGVGDDYGRTTKGRWRAARKSEVSA